MQAWLTDLVAADRLVAIRKPLLSTVVVFSTLGMLVQAMRESAAWTQKP
jgi:hypothetical protein